MNSQTLTALVDGPAGAIEVALDQPVGGSRGVAVVSHPHPLFGGTMANKVVQTLARAFLHHGWSTVRFNFRGVGRSSGTHDGGPGEIQDLLRVVALQAPDGPLCLAGFSFGAFVTSHAVEQLRATRDIHRVLLVGTAASRFEVAPIDPELHERTLIIHGERDDTVPLAAVMDWARPQKLPVMVVPDVEHFFHGQLPLLKGLAIRHIGG